MNRLRIEGINGGTVIDEVNEALDQLVQDLVDRPELMRARSAELVITLTPDTPPHTAAEQPILDIQLKVKMPAKILAALKGVIEDGQLQFDLERIEAAA